MSTKGILHKDLELLIDDERELPLALKKDHNFVQTTINLIDYKTSNSNISLKQHCSCCGECLKNNSSFLAPAPSPRVPYNKLSENEYEFRVLDVDRTLSVVRGGNIFFGTPLRKLPSGMGDSNDESILHQLKKECQRMMDEQEALQSMSSDLEKKEEEIKELEDELEAYKERHMDV
ncbi:unnamed protein product [Eruca vesicaria subsp. sativa]|uniref:Uncharacterized protein n=1 Tax=Eruca vesicaria subsp. sativa TaxID=29727 RepID=A0ABC8L6W4_ERUVS|nr:unnamed protein product [Eruca vesicaria subsp. sativa]